MMPWDERTTEGGARAQSSRRSVGVARLAHAMHAHTHAHNTRARARTHARARAKRTRPPKRTIQHASYTHVAGKREPVHVGEFGMRQHSLAGRGSAAGRRVAAQRRLTSNPVGLGSRRPASSGQRSRRLATGVLASPAASARTDGERRAALAPMCRICEIWGVFLFSWCLRSCFPGS